MKPFYGILVSYKSESGVDEEDRTYRPVIEYLHNGKKLTIISDKAYGQMKWRIRRKIALVGNPDRKETVKIFE